jgi:hypothetical protein
MRFHNIKPIRKSKRHCRNKMGLALKSQAEPDGLGRSFIAAWMF